MRSQADQLTRGEKRKLSLAHTDILDWSKSNGRDFPWRRANEPIYRQICVEVLLQRTRAETVSAFYDEFFGQFPSWETLAAAHPVHIGEIIKPIGLWRRRSEALSNLARYAAERDGQFPGDMENLLKAPAVGQYVANAILMLQHGQPRPLLDSSFARVIERFLRPRKLADIRYDPWLQEASAWLVRHPSVARANWSILDFAAKVCRARVPRCHACPLAARCPSRIS